MALTIFVAVVVAGLVFQVGFLIALLRDHTQEVCMIDTVTAHDAKPETPPQPGTTRQGYLWRKAAMFILPLFLIPASLRAQSRPTSKLIQMDVLVNSVR